MGEPRSAKAEQSIQWIDRSGERFGATGKAGKINEIDLSGEGLSATPREGGAMRRAGIRRNKLRD
jgi:hypothetical protein